MAQLLVAGGTGLVGSAVMELAVSDIRFSRVVAWGRRPVGIRSGHIEHWGPVEGDLVAGLRSERMDAVICCLGTTMKDVKGDRKAFIHVDRDLVVSLGRWASGKVVRFCVVSAVGANRKSLFFYNRVKGEMEDELQRMDLAALHMFRPSVLDGPRGPGRPGERAALMIMKALGPVLPATSRPMPVHVLARALLNTAAMNDDGIHTPTYRDIMDRAR